MASTKAATHKPIRYRIIDGWFIRLRITDCDSQFVRGKESFLAIHKSLLYDLWRPSPEERPPEEPLDSRCWKAPEESAVTHNLGDNLPDRAMHHLTFQCKPSFSVSSSPHQTATSYSSFLSPKEVKAFLFGLIMWSGCLIRNIYGFRITESLEQTEKLYGLSNEAGAGHHSKWRWWWLR